MDTKKLVEEVRKRQVIWDTGSRDHSNKHKMAAAWRQICIISWPEFDTLQADQKRVKCLELQKRWRNIKETFTKDLQTEKHAKGRTTPSQKHDQLSFLIPIIEKSARQVQPGADTESESQRPIKRRRTDTSDREEPVASSTNSLESRDARDRDVEEDRLFLLSLVSFMQDVPRGSKLALRADMIKLIGTYTSGRSDTTDSPQY